MHPGEAATGPFVANVGEVADGGGAQGQQQAGARYSGNRRAQGVGVEFPQQVPAGQQAEGEHQQDEGDDDPLPVGREIVEPADLGGFFADLAVGRLFHWWKGGAHRVPLGNVRH
ncbi:hypothetical protein D9M68_421360 [compost metagenome]